MRKQRKYSNRLLKFMEKVPYHGVYDFEGNTDVHQIKWQIEELIGEIPDDKRGAVSFLIVFQST